jgi:hypothetical protein
VTSGEDGGEAPQSIVLRDEDDQLFTFKPIRALRDGADVFLIAEREGTGTLHVLIREGDVLGLVRDHETLRRVALRLEILRRAMEGEHRMARHRSAAVLRRLPSRGGGG